jgi:hypothetical protein
MPISTDVNLPKTQRPIFPERCVGCGLPDAGASVRVCTNAIGWWTIALWAFGRRFCVDVPVCDSCRRQMLTQKRVRRIVTWGLVIVGVVVAGYLLAAYRGPFKRWLALGIALVCLLPMILWETFVPPPIDLTAFSDTVDYEFRNTEYAAEFASLNNGKLDGDDT